MRNDKFKIKKLYENNCNLSFAKDLCDKLVFDIILLNKKANFIIQSDLDSSYMLLLIDKNFLFG